jgi:hypothetical protein
MRTQASTERERDHQTQCIHVYHTPYMCRHTLIYVSSSYVCGEQETTATLLDPIYTYIHICIHIYEGGERTVRAGETTGETTGLRAGILHIALALCGPRFAYCYIYVLILLYMCIALALCAPGFSIYLLQ